MKRFHVSSPFSYSGYCWALSALHLGSGPGVPDQPSPCTVKPASLPPRVSHWREVSCSRPISSPRDSLAWPFPCAGFRFSFYHWLRVVRLSSVSCCLCLGFLALLGSVRFCVESDLQHVPLLFPKVFFLAFLFA